MRRRGAARKSVTRAKYPASEPAAIAGRLWEKAASLVRLSLQGATWPFLVM